MLRSGPPIEDDYALGRVLGQGSYGVVRLATRLSTGEPVAVKTIQKTGLVSNPTSLSALRREVEILHHLAGHPHVSGTGTCTFAVGPGASIKGQRTPGRQDAGAPFRLVLRSLLASLRVQIGQLYGAYEDCKCLHLVMELYEVRPGVRHGAVCCGWPAAC